MQRPTPEMRDFRFLSFVVCQQEYFRKSLPLISFSYDDVMRAIARKNHRGNINNFLFYKYIVSSWHPRINNSQPNHKHVVKIADLQTIFTRVRVWQKNGLVSWLSALTLARSRWNVDFDLVRFRYRGWLLTWRMHDEEHWHIPITLIILYTVS